MQAGFRIDGKPETLIALDRRGLLAAPGESVEEYLARIRGLQRSIGALDEALSRDGRYEVEGMEVFSRDRIRPSFFDGANSQCLRLFGFSADWVPAFFINPSFSFLFGGCSFSMPPDFFSMFIIRRSFKNSRRWLFYGRDELIAHEMCHVARAPLESRTFEESFAYRTSASPFRRLMGGIFLSQWDSFLLLGSTFVLLLAQLCNVFLARIPMWPFWLLPLLVLAWLLLRYRGLRRRMAKAQSALEAKYGENAAKVLFRCGDEEIDALAKGSFPDTLDAPGSVRAVVLRQWKLEEKL